MGRSVTGQAWSLPPESSSRISILEIMEIPSFCATASFKAQRKDRTTLPYVREFIRLCRETPGRQPESVPVQDQKKGSQEYS